MEKSMMRGNIIVDVHGVLQDELSNADNNTTENDWRSFMPSLARKHNIDIVTRIKTSPYNISFKEVIHGKGRRVILDCSVYAHSQYLKTGSINEVYELRI